MCFWYISQSLPPIWYTLYEVWNIFQALFQIPLYWPRIRDKIYTNLFEIFDCINASFFDSLLGHWILLIMSKYTHITFPWFVIIINQKHTMLGWYDIFGCQVCWVSTGSNRGQLGVFFFWQIFSFNTEVANPKATAAVCQWGWHWVLGCGDYEVYDEVYERR